MKRRALMGLMALLPLQTFAQPDNMRTLRNQVLQAIRQKYPELRPSEGKDDASIEIDASTKTGTIDVTNLHATLRQLPADRRREAIDDFLTRLFSGAGVSSNATWAAASKLIRPRLVPDAARSDLPKLCLRDFVPGVLVAYVLDYGQRVEYVRRDRLEAWAVDSQRIHDTAIANLEFLSEAVEIDSHQVNGGGLYAVIDTLDSYDAARLLLPRFRERLLGALGEPIFVGIPNRDFLVAWSSDNAQFATFVANVREDAGQQPYPITRTIFRVDRRGVDPATKEELGKR